VREHPAPALTLTEAQEDHRGNSGDDEDPSGCDEEAVLGPHVPAVRLSCGGQRTANSRFTRR
jgi:hypothetical protein